MHQGVEPKYLQSYWDEFEFASAGAQLADGGIPNLAGDFYPEIAANPV